MYSYTISSRFGSGAFVRLNDSSPKQCARLIPKKTHYKYFFEGILKGKFTRDFLHFFFTTTPVGPLVKLKRFSKTLYFHNTEFKSFRITAFVVCLVIVMSAKHAGLWIRIHFFRIQIQLFFSMRIRIRIQQVKKCGSGSSLKFF